MKQIVKAGRTSKSVFIFVPQPGGAGLTGLAYNTSGVSCRYIRSGQAASSSITLADMTVGTWVSGGFKEVSALTMPGVYEFGIPDACLAAGADSVIIHFQFGNQAGDHVKLEIQLVSVDLMDAVRFGLTALPNANAGANGGLPLGDASGRVDLATDAIDADALKSDAVAEIQSGLSTLDAAGVRAALGLASANLDTQLGAIAANVATALGDIAAVDARLITVHGIVDDGTTGMAATGQGVIDLLTRLSNARALLLDNLALLDEAISSRLAAASYTAPDNATIAHVETLAERVDALIEDVGGDRFTGKALEEAPTGGGSLTQQEVRDAMLLAPSDDPEDGSIDDQLSDIETRLTAIGSASVSVVSPLSAGGDLTLYAGYDYTSGTGQEPTWSSDSWPDLTGATVSVVHDDADETEISACDVLDVGESVQVVKATGFTQEVTSELGQHTVYVYRLKAVLASSEEVMLARGKLSVR